MAVSKKEVSPCPIDAMLSSSMGGGRGQFYGGYRTGLCVPANYAAAFPALPSGMLIRHLQDLVNDGIIERHEEEKARPVFVTRSRNMVLHWSPFSKPSVYGKKPPRPVQRLCVAKRTSNLLKRERALNR